MSDWHTEPEEDRDLIERGADVLSWILLALAAGCMVMFGVSAWQLLGGM